MYAIHGKFSYTWKVLNVVALRGYGYGCAFACVCVCVCVCGV